MADAGVGVTEGVAVGRVVETAVWVADGASVGREVGLRVGTSDGAPVGADAALPFVASVAGRFQVGSVDAGVAMAGMVATEAPH
jgi:hypothetical protein